MDVALQPQVGQTATLKHRIVIVGGGAAGITVAAEFLRRDASLDVAIVEPSETHSYQPGWTLVGAGVFTRRQTERAERSLVPKGVTWLKAEVSAFDPDNNIVRLSDGRALGYDYLVACPGLKVDWDAIQGLKDTLGKNGVCSNYRADTAEYTWRLIQDFKGGTALFTQPPMPIKCAGAPQKIMYMMADHLRRRGRLSGTKLKFCLAGDALFGVPFFVPPLQRAVDGYGIEVAYKHNLIAINGPAKSALFSVTNKDGEARDLEMRFDMIHVVPPQMGLDVVRNSPLANPAGWIEVDPATLQHVRYPNVFSLGDAASTTNAKTAAAVRLQAPVVVANLLAAMKGSAPAKTYDGYGSCPLTVSLGKIVLAEFAYGGKVTPSFPLDPRVPRRSMWYLKTKFLPWLYWSHMLRGGTIDIKHRERGW
ncbi:NAD(P)/FAD-dependent oxidoreductase [Brucella grignonensis]|uniref:Pyridine nucleotide-disulfide oxidoreductase family protein n=1 Tax=Brucella grignonensis TaxID=94627 RepID=A0A256FSA2_9HYPH|nr:FAD/NAD(P)-binding oxidoreductase [Brucella grignonensis]OYR17714.1 pyridine nucleotide-disulfide oxidoreductase family protein [Brucella grignonensis]